MAPIATNNGEVLEVVYILRGVHLKVITPLHVSGLWIPIYSDDPLKTGSIGAGINLSIYAVATGRRGSCRVLLNNREVFTQHSKVVCSGAGVDVESNIYTPLDLGLGFGVSAATLISHSVYSFTVAGKPFLKALQLAHKLEVEGRTGLGDVIAEYTGGLAIRVSPGAPGFGYAYRVIPRGDVRLLAVSIGVPEETPSMLSRMSTSLCEYGEVLLRKVVESEDLMVYFESSRLFTSRLFDYSIVERVVSGLNGIISYYLKKSALIMWVEREYIGEVIGELERKRLKPIPTTISQVGVLIAHTPNPPT
jgi:pantoate kinase